MDVKVWVGWLCSFDWEIFIEVEGEIEVLNWIRLVFVLINSNG